MAFRTDAFVVFVAWVILVAACGGCNADSSDRQPVGQPWLKRELYAEHEYHTNTYDPWPADDDIQTTTTTQESLSNELPWGTLNFVVVTDVHSWIAGNHRDDPRHWPYDAHRQPLQDADYGDVLGFYQHLQSLVADHNDAQSNNNKRDLFFVMNGDFVDGTGLSGFPPTHLAPLLERMPWDAMNIGNHELYHDETVRFVADTQHETNTTKWKTGGYLSSNTVLSSTHRPLVGNRYVYLEGKHTNTTVLAFGFLYDFHEGGPSSTTLSVEDTIREPWFSDVLQGPKHFDAIVVLAHMDCLHPLVDVLLEGIRSALPPDQRFKVPIQFVTGHTHRRCHSKLDDRAESFEAGRFLDTIGFVSLDVNDHRFQHRFLDATRASLRDTLARNRQHQDLADDFGTPEGRALSRSIAATKASLGLDTVLGCSPQTYGIFEQVEGPSVPAHTDPDSLWHVYLRSMIPTQLLAPLSSDSSEPAEPIFVAGSGTLRYSLFEGPITLNDLVAMDPFGNTVSELVSGSSDGNQHPIYGWQLERWLEAANELYSTVAEYGMPCFVLSGLGGETDVGGVAIDSKKTYRVFATAYDAKRLLKVLNDNNDDNDSKGSLLFSPPSITNGRSYESQPVCIGETSSSNNGDCTTVSLDLWKDYIRETMPCATKPSLRWGTDGSHSLDAVSAQLLQPSSATTARVHSRMTPTQEEASSLANDQRAAVILVAGAALLITYLLVFPPEPTPEPTPHKSAPGRRQLTTDQKLSPPQRYSGRWRKDDGNGDDVQLIPLCRRNTDHCNEESYGSVSI